IAVGEDGPTHQPVEHVASLRCIPGMTVIRPADAAETVEAWKTALTSAVPVSLILSRQNLPILDRKRYPSAENLKKGAYVLSDFNGKPPEIILIATGSEVQLAIAAGDRLAEQGIAVRVVNMPSWELFEKSSQEYKNSVLLPNVKARLAIEAGISMGWDRYVGDKGAVIGMNGFGASAPGNIVMQKFGFTVENVVNKAIELLK
ncbi:MAG: transketolase, partial [Desulfobacteraceae bacterium IS3]